MGRRGRSSALMKVHFGFALVAISVWGALARDLPDLFFTPGEADNSLTMEVLCTPGFSPSKLRNVPTARRRAIYKVYGMQPLTPPCPCEVDHLIPLGIGGSNRPRNLWPQPELTRPWNSKMKDQLEIRLRSEVCGGKIELTAAQREIATDWTAAYVKRFGAP